MKKIIYGESNFRKVTINHNYLYIDKTPYIKRLEEYPSNYVIFLRPRRFGKSLFVSTLQYYYDEKSAHEFEAMFGDTYIGKHPTPLKNSFRILFFEFSGIDVDGNQQRLFDQFTFKIRMALEGYFSEYGYPNTYGEELRQIDNPTSLMEYFFTKTQNDTIYLLIDEYDQFANAILAYSMEDFLQIVGKGGFVRSFYEVIKAATQTGVVQKMFITGVTPITLDSLSSGFNIVKHITYDKRFNALAGFTQKEVEYALTHSLFQVCPDRDKEALLEKLQQWYNGYLFSEEATCRIYNATLINYFIVEFDTDRCAMPKKMLDSNVASDYRAIMKLFHIGDSERNYRILESLIEKGTITGIIKDRYDLNQPFQEDDFITLIYSMGFITIQEGITGDLYLFKIPNYVIKMLYFNYFAIELQRRNHFQQIDSYSQLMIKLVLGDIKPFQTQLSTVIKTLSNRDHQGFSEKHFQVITLALLSFAEFYFIDSQPELNNNYPDILLIGRDEKVPNNYLFELKWLKKHDQFESIKQAGVEQVKRYLQLDKVKAIPKLRSFLLLGSKEGVVFVEVASDMSRD